MKKFVMLFLIFSIALAASIDAAAFFRPDRVHVRVDPIEPPEDSQATAPKAFSCSLLLRYDKPRPQAIELTYLGNLRGPCDAGYEAAIGAASNAVPPLKVAPQEKAAEMGDRPALVPVYQCAITVSFDQAAPSQVSQTLSGTGCESTQGAALSAARPMVRCALRGGFCQP